jgi:hypothetical protein
MGPPQVDGGIQPHRISWSLNRIPSLQKKSVANSLFICVPSPLPFVNTNTFFVWRIHFFVIVLYELWIQKPSFLDLAPIHHLQCSDISIVVYEAWSQTRHGH